MIFCPSLFWLTLCHYESIFLFLMTYCPCITGWESYLLCNSHVFSGRKKKEIRNLGKPLPNLDVNQKQKSRSLIQVCTIKNTGFVVDDVIQGFLFSLSCVFSGDTTRTENGVPDLGHIHEKIKHFNNAYLFQRNI